MDRENEVDPRRPALTMWAQTRSMKISAIFLWLMIFAAGNLYAQLTSDCARDSPNTIFIALRADGIAGSGTKANPFDGSTAQKFDKLLRQRAEAGQRDLIVCIGPGRFDTLGRYDYIMNVGHQEVLDYGYPPAGFTIGKNWKIHGAGSSGENRTTLRLMDIYRRPRSGVLSGVVFATISDDASGVEISDLEIDDNFRALGQADLSAISLRSDYGGNWIHRVNVINAEGSFSETFPVSIMSVNFHPSRSRNNLIENVTMSDWGGGQCTAISMAGAAGEIRNNTVSGYQIAYGGWILNQVWFHDNRAIDAGYGFNIDSGVNHDVTIERNQIVHPRGYGIVVGGGYVYSGFKILSNTIEINANSVAALVFLGNVTNSVVAKNTLIANRAARGAKALKFRGSGNSNLAFDSNTISSFLAVPTLDETNCASSNVDQDGHPVAALSSRARSCVQPSQ